MARHRFGPEVLLTGDSSTPPHALLAPGLAFTVWTEATGGTDVSTLLVDTDGITPFATVVSTDGEIPAFLGPDTLESAEVYALYIDAGSGERYPMYADDRIRELIDNEGAGTDAQTVAQQALDVANATADALAQLDAVKNLGGVTGLLGRTAAEGLPPIGTLAEGTYVFVDQT